MFLKKFLSIGLVVAFVLTSAVFAEKCGNGEYWDGNSCEPTTQSCNIVGGDGEKYRDGRNHSVIDVEYNGEETSDPILESRIAKQPVHPDRVSFKYRETSYSHGHGVALVDENGIKIAGVTTDNPQWDVYDSNGFDSDVHSDVGANPNYQTWYKVTIDLNWDDNTFDVIWNKVGSDTTYIKNDFDLAGDNLQSIQVVNYHNRGWSDNRLRSKVKEINVYPDSDKENVLTMLDENHGDGDYDNDNISFHSEDNKYFYTSLENKGDTFYKTNMYSNIPTMTGNDRVSRSDISQGIDYNFNYYTDIISEKEEVLDFKGKNNLELKFYPPAYSFIQNNMDNKVFRFGQGFTVNNSLGYFGKTYEDSSTEVTDLSLLYQFDYNTISSKYEECILVKPLVKLDTLTNIEAESVNDRYYVFNGSEDNTVKGFSGANHLMLYPSKELWTDDRENFDSSNENYEGLVKNFDGNPISITGKELGDIKVLNNSYLENFTADEQFSLGGIAKWNIDKCSNVSKEKALNGELDIKSYLAYEVWDKYGNKNLVKMKASSVGSLIEKNEEMTNESLLKNSLEKEEESDTSTDEDGPSSEEKIGVTTNPTSVQGMIGSDESIKNIESESQRVKLGKEVFTLNKELNDIKKKIAEIYRGKEIKKINNSLVNLSNTPTGDISSDLGDYKKENTTKYSDEEYKYFEFSNGSSGVRNLVAFTGTNYENKNVVVVKGADVYIKENILKGDKKAGLLLVVLKDKYGNGGNIFVDPKVTNIESFLISEGSLLSAEDKDNNLKIDYADEILDENVKDMDYIEDNLINQLYIYGSVHTRNTLGGANDPFRIPPVDSIIMSGIEAAGSIDSNAEFQQLAKKNYVKALDIAKRFDINYLRYYTAYFSGDDVLPLYTGSKAAGGFVFDGTQEEREEVDSSLRNPEDKFHAFVVDKDLIYNDFSIFE